MIKLAGAFCPREMLTRAECRSHYAERHGPLVRSVVSFSRHVIRYTQHDCGEMSPPIAPIDDAICGITQLWFKDLAALRAAYQEPEYIKIIRPDEHRFVHLSKSLIVIGDETSPLPGGNDTPVRVFRFLSVAARCNDSDFTSFRREIYAPAIAADECLSALLAGYTQTQTVSKSENPFEGAPMYHALDEFRLHRVDDLAPFLQREGDIALRLNVAHYADNPTCLVTNSRRVI
jgi:EthD domain